MSSLPGNRASLRPGLQQTAHEAFTVSLCGLRQRSGATAAQCRARDDLGLSTHFVAAGRFQLPASAELLGLRRRGDRALWTLGRRMDDAGAAVALSALGHLGDRQCSADAAGRRAMVLAMAVRTLARCQCPLKTALLQRFQAKGVASCREPELCNRIGSVSSMEDVNDALEKSSSGSRSPTDRFIGGACHRHRHCRDRPLLQSKSEAASHPCLHRAQPKRALVKRFVSCVRSRCELSIGCPSDPDRGN
jgi:hypothetical protein